MQTSSSRSLWLGHRQYWLCQGIFWLAIAGPELGTLLVKGGNAKGADAVMISALLQTVAGLLATHLYRFLLIRSGWRERKLGFLWWRMSLVVGAAACLTSLPTSLFLYQEAQIQIRETVEKLPAAQAIIDEAPLRFGEAWVSLGATDALIQVAWVIIYLAAKAQRSLAAARRREQELQTALKESELSALRAHLNPHFFFNTLNTLRTLIDLNPAQARLAVDHLADLMRLTLRIGSQRAVPLRTELSMVQAYLDLEKMRFEERLIIVEEIQPDTLDQAVPPFALQTLVENALKHGVGQRLEGGTVRVKAWRQSPAEFRLEVRSPGPLRTPALEAPGTGLRNLRERIHLGFGEASSLVITEEPPEVVATLAIIHENTSGNSTPLPG